MTKLRILSLLASAAFSAALLVLLFGVTGIKVAAVERLLLGVPPHAFAEIAALLAFNNFLAGEKWRLIVRGLHRKDDRDMPRYLYFAFTSIGMALGQIAPAPLALVASRSIGAHLHGGRALVRGASATLFDYFFDLVVAGVLALCSALVLIAGGREASWGTCAAVAGTAAFLLYGPAARLTRRTAGWLGRRAPGRWGQMLAAVAASPLLVPKIGRRLLAMSVLRYAVVVLIAGISARALVLDLPWWKLAAGLPFATIATALAITPGGLGVNEWAVSSVLFAFGTSLQVSAEWALVCRVLVAVAAALCGLVGFAIAAAAHFFQPDARVRILRLLRLVENGR